MSTIFGGFPGTTGGSTTAPPGNGNDLLTPPLGDTPIINPWDYPQAWRSILLNLNPSPGLCVDCAGMNPVKWDKRDGTGITGATVVFNGEGLAEFDARIQLGWEGPTLPSRAAQWNQWAEWKKLLLPPTTRTPSALAIWYPSLDMLPVPIVAVIVHANGATGPKQVANGVWEWVIPFQQFRMAKPASAKPAGAGANVGGDATDALITTLSGIGDTL